MGFGKIRTRSLSGLAALPVQVEAHVAGGLSVFSIVGLPEAAIRESRHRIRAALINSGFSMPEGKIIVALAPAELPKQGSGFDLPIALAILLASGQLPELKHSTHISIEALEFAAELSLDGQLRSVRGALPMCIACQQDQRRLVLPLNNLDETCLCGPDASLGSGSLIEVVDALVGGLALRPPPGLPEDSAASQAMGAGSGDLAEVRGQVQAKRALEIAAAGQHSLLLAGPPGTGKSMLASRLPSLLPSLCHQQMLQVASIRSLRDPEALKSSPERRPFRSPHHSASAAALVGGGSPPAPGEVSLAHHGVLFLDELPEFSRHVLDGLREPLETGKVCIARAAHQAVFPASFQLVAAMNPCPCGYTGDSQIECVCSSEVVRRYQSKVSGPLLDRIDLRVVVPRLGAEELLSLPRGESSESVRARVVTARAAQQARQQQVNGLLPVSALQDVCALGKPEQQTLLQLADKARLSSRAVHRLLRLARTIADLDAQPHITRPHLMEAMSLHRLPGMLAG